MHRHELDDLTDAFVNALQAKLPPHLSSFGPATPDRLREACRAHVEEIAGEGREREQILASAASLVADLLAVLSAAPAQPAAPAAVQAETSPEKTSAKKGSK
jgi:hypothetical protein